MPTPATTADDHAAAPGFRAQPFPLRWEGTDLSRPVEFLGVAYEKVESEISGGSYMRFDADSPESYEVQLHDQPRPIVFADVPDIESVAKAAAAGVWESPR